MTDRLLDSIKRKIFLLIGRGVVKTVTPTTGTQGVQVVALDNETISDIERLEEYGFTSVPLAESEAVIGFPNGNRDQGIVLCIGDRRYRPTNLASGEVSVYDNNGSKILLKADGSIEIESKNKMTIKAPSGTVVEDVTGVQLKTGDATAWMPNILKVDPFSGIPHGGPGAGIVKLTGG